jgi:hypothetical protein
VRSVARLIACALLLAALPGAALAQEGEAAPTRLEIRAQPAPTPELSDFVAATLRDVDGAPIGGARISFSIHVDFLGGRMAALGSAATDATGVALVPITPRTDTVRVQATFAGDADHAPSDATADVRFPDARVVAIDLEPEPSQLETLRIVVPRVIGIVVGALWIFFALATAYVIRAVRRGGPPNVTTDQHEQQLGKGAP